MSTLKQQEPADAANTLFQSSLYQNGEWLKEPAINLGVDPDAFHAVAVMPVPFLACSRRWADRSLKAGWKDIVPCASLAGLTEVRGT
jgi:hypothetical protein